MSDSVTTLRKQLKKKRASLSQEQQRQSSKTAVQQIQRSSIFRSAKAIAIYLPVRGEIDPTELRRLAHPRQQFYLPVLSPFKAHGLVFVRWDENTRFKQNRFGIPEPLIQHSRTIASRNLDLVITPLLAFDKNGHRLGMGGGFYDRTFAFKRNYQHQPRPVLAGIAYDFQEQVTISRQPWDIPLDWVFTNLNQAKFNHK